MTEQTLTRPVADRDDLEQYFHDQLAEGKLVFQRAGDNAWLPPRQEDPATLSDKWEWVEASGEARLISWVTYHLAYHPFFEDKLPYKVGVVELVEGPRMIAPLDIDDHDLVLEMPLKVSIRHDCGEWVPMFVPGQGS